MDTNIDFSNEDWGKSVKFSDRCWVIAEKHNPSFNKTMEFNNRTFVFKLINVPINWGEVPKNPRGKKQRGGHPDDRVRRYVIRYSQSCNLTVALETC